MIRDKFLLSVALCSAIIFIACTQIGSEINEEIILNQISEPVIPSFSVSLTQYGAIADGKTDCKSAIDSALKELKKKGGGRLIIPPGDYLVNGPIHLISNIELNIEKGSRLLFGSNYDDYLPVVRTSWEGTFLYNYSPFIYAYNCSNISITGYGIIDGQAADTWATWKAIQKDDQLLSREMNHKNVPIENRVFGKEHYLRPQLIQFFDCNTIKIENVTIEDSPFWCLHLLSCENVVIRGISFNAFNYNNDGIDAEYSRNVLIEEVNFNNSDDNIAIKAGRDDEGRASDVCSENIVVRNCHFRGLHALVIGSEMSAGVKNVFVSDCDFSGPLKRGIYFKSNPDRGGFMNNIFISNLSFGEVEDCIYITSFYHGEGEGHVTDISDIYIDNVSCEYASGTGIAIQGYPEKKVRDIFLTKIRIDSVENPLSMIDTENIVLSDVVIGNLVGTPSWAN